MTRVGFITWTSKGFAVGAAAPAPAPKPEPVRRPARAARSRRPAHTTSKELSRR
jgi:hypothetical protein